jgi:hypothetical protein
MKGNNIKMYSFFLLIFDNPIWRTASASFKIANFIQFHIWKCACTTVTMTSPLYHYLNWKNHIDQLVLQQFLPSFRWSTATSWSPRFAFCLPRCSSGDIVGFTYSCYSERMSSSQGITGFSSWRQLKRGLDEQLFCDWMIYYLMALLWENFIWF